MSMSANTLQWHRREQKVRPEGKLCNCNAAIFFYFPLPSLSGRLPAFLIHSMKCQQLHLSEGRLFPLLAHRFSLWKSQPSTASWHMKIVFKTALEKWIPKRERAEGVRWEMKSGKAAWINCGRQRVTERSREKGRGATKRQAIAKNNGNRCGNMGK